MLNRRDFIQQIAAGSLGMMATTGVMGNNWLNQNKMALDGNLQGLLPVAGITDAFNLTFSIPEIHKTTRIVLTQHLAWKVPGNKGWMANFSISKDDELKQVVDHLLEKKTDPKAQSKLSLICGAFTFSAFQKNIYPIYSKNKGNLPEMVMYQDAFLLDQIAGKENVKPNQKDLETLFKELAPRAVTRIHTLIADSDDVETWLHNMVKWRRDYNEVCAKMAQIVTNPDQGKMKKFVTGENFYAADDEVISLARKFQAVERVTGDDVRKAIEGNPKSLYGKALVESIKDILILDQYIKGEVSTLG